MRDSVLPRPSEDADRLFYDPPARTLRLLPRFMMDGGDESLRPLVCLADLRRNPFAAAAGHYLI
jgi:hypothetical protein